MTARPLENPLILSPPLLQGDASQHSFRTLRRQVGNTGNLLFIHALRRVLHYDDLVHGLQFDPSELREQHDGIVVAAANWLSPRHNFDELASRIEATDLPCVVVGIGAQARSEAKIPELQPGVLRLMKVASERSHSISVRGDYSAEVLAHYGIDNVTVTGCPSLLWNLDGAHRVAKPPRQVTRVVLNSSRGAPDERLFTRQARRVQTSRLNVLLPRLALQRNLDFVAQTELPDIYHALGKQDEDRSAEKFPGYLARVYGTGDTRELDDFLSQHMKVFFDVEAWMRYLADQHFVFGTRLHGAIAALLAGTPAVLVTHDSRTAEMARQASIPSVRAETVTEDVDLQRVYDGCDVESFNRRAPAYYERFAQFFDANGLKHRLPRSSETTGVTAHAEDRRRGGSRGRRFRLRRRASARRPASE